MSYPLQIQSKDACVSKFISDGVQDLSDNHFVGFIYPCRDLYISRDKWLGYCGCILTAKVMIINMIPRNFMTIKIRVLENFYKFQISA